MDPAESATPCETRAELPGLEKSDAMPAKDAVSRLDFLTVLRVSGPDALAWLQGQLTADVGEVDATASRLAAWCSPKGRVLATFRLLADPSGGYRMVCERWFAETLLPRLRMYILRSDVRFDDAREEIDVAGVTGTRALPEPVAVWASTAEVDDAAEIEELAIARVPGRHRRFIVTGPPTVVASIIQPRADGGVRYGSSDAWHLADLRAGIARITARTSGTFLPQMLNLDRLRAVSFEKGCYVGQEIVARTQHLGRIKRRAFIGQSAATIAAGDAVLDVSRDGAPRVGDVVSAEPRPGGGSVALVVLNMASAGSATLRVGRSQGPPILIPSTDAVESSD